MLIGFLLDGTFPEKSWWDKTSSVSVGRFLLTTEVVQTLVIFGAGAASGSSVIWPRWVISSKAEGCPLEEVCCLFQIALHYESLNPWQIPE